MPSANNSKDQLDQIHRDKQAAQNKFNDAQYELEKAEEAKEAKSKGRKPS